MFLAVYGADTVCTILHRLYLKENIFEAHRHHFYQILSNDYKIEHRLVAILYASLQILSSILVIYLYQQNQVVLAYILILFPLKLINLHS